MEHAMGSHFDPSALTAVHATATSLLAAAAELTCWAARRPSVPDEELLRLIDTLYGWLVEYHRLDLAALDCWLSANREGGQRTALEEIARFGDAVRDAVWPTEQRRPSLRTSGLMPKEVADVRRRVGPVTSSVRSFHCPDVEDLERRLDDELLRARNLARMPDEAVVTALLGGGARQQTTGSGHHPEVGGPSKPGRGTAGAKRGTVNQRMLDELHRNPLRNCQVTS
jgi:hypothetical protein